MRKALSNNFRFYFLVIFFLHLFLLFAHLSRTHKTQVTSINAPVKIKVLPQGFDPTRQIVQSEDPAEKTSPKANARQSDKNRSFDRETKASIVRSFSTGGKGKAGKGGTGTKDLSLAALGGEMSKKNPFAKAAKEYTEAKSSGGTKGNNGRSVSSTTDYLAGIPLGDVTHLNTVENKFYGYYFRIRQKLEGFWGRSVQEKAETLAGQGRQIASDEEHVTALRIVMDQAGEIVEVVILGSSGVKELDDAAIDSFNDAGPFPNPPKDLIVDGRVTIEWGFVVNS